jgi:hypothetical protein
MVKKMDAEAKAIARKLRAATVRLEKQIAAGKRSAKAEYSRVKAKAGSLQRQGKARMTKMRKAMA